MIKYRAEKKISEISTWLKADVDRGKSCQIAELNYLWNTKLKPKKLEHF